MTECTRPLYRQRVTVAVIAEEELPLIVDGHDVVRFDRLAPHPQRMCRRRASLAGLHQVGPAEDVAYLVARPMRNEQRRA